MAEPADDCPLPAAPGRFQTTRWSLVLAAGDASAPEAHAALQTLSQGYWYPLYAYARRRGASADDAADLTQEFFARLIEGDLLQTVDPRKGRFRTFLLTVFQRFLASDHARRRALKRGGNRLQLSIDAGEGERRYAFEPVDLATPELLFERRWALTLLEHVLDLLEQEYRQKGKGALFYHCRAWLAGSPVEASYSAAATSLEMTEVALRVTVHRLRQRYRDLLREVVAGTVNSPEEVEEELQALRMAISGPTA